MPDEPKQPATPQFPTVLEPAPGQKNIISRVPYFPTAVGQALEKAAYTLNKMPVFGGILGGFVESLLYEMGKNGDASSITEVEYMNARSAPGFGHMDYKPFEEKEAKAKEERKKLLEAFEAKKKQYGLDRNGRNGQNGKASTLVTDAILPYSLN